MDKAHNKISSLVPACSSSLTDISCISGIVSKLLGYGIILGSVFLKLPQVLKILNEASVDGLSLVSILLETLCFIITGSYNNRSGHPFSTYGELLFMAIQNVIIVSLFLRFGKDKKSPILAISGIFVSSVLTIYLLPMSIVAILQSSTVFIFIGSRLPQIVSNYKRKSSSPLSGITVFMQFGGVCARMLTIIKEVDDPIMLGTSAIGVLLNGILLLQVIMYRSKSKTQ